MIAFRRCRKYSWLALVLACGAPALPPARVLFIGNSYTLENNLPRLFADLAAAGNHTVHVQMAVIPGGSLAQHARSPATRDTLSAHEWTYVVLQEQSVLPSIPRERAASVYPAVRQFARAIHAAHAESVLLLTWARRDGFREAGFPDYASMQAQITAGYTEIADELNLRVAPAGVAWQNALAADSTLDLWQTDGSHPKLAGSYLAACVLYATIFGESPVGLPVPAALSPVTARQLQRSANETVLRAPARWHLR